MYIDGTHRRQGRDVQGLGPYGCRVALQINSCCTMPVSAALGRACGVEWSTHMRHVARAPKPKRPVVTGVAMPGHRHSRRGCFCTKGASLNDRGAGDPIRRFYYASERSRSGTWSHHRHTESCKPNKTKQNKTVRKSFGSLTVVARIVWVGTVTGCYCFFRQWQWQWQF